MATISLSLGTLAATVDTAGAQLTSLSLGGVGYLWNGDARWWPRHAPVLFPIVGNLRKDAATSAQGPCRMGRHGVARTREHVVEESRDSKVTLRLDADEQTLAAYPYDFTLRVTYELEGPSTLSHTFSVTNNGAEPMPFCVGGHPAFNVPAGGLGRFEDCELRFAEPWTATSPVIVEGGLLDYGQLVPVINDSATLPLSHELFAHDALVLEGVPASTVTLAGPDGRGVRVDFEGFDHLGVWSAAPSKDGLPCPFVALEPWCGTATRTDEDDVLEHKQNVIVAAPGQVIERTFRITLL